MTAQYVFEVVKGHVEAAGIDQLAQQGQQGQQGQQARPAAVIACFNMGGRTPQQLEAEALRRVDALRQVISWATGNETGPFAIVTATPDGTYFRLLPPPVSQRHRLGPESQSDFTARLAHILELAEQNERFAFALSMLHDATRERNPQFKVARLFACLEALAYKLKSADRPSRRAVTFMLGLDEGGTSQVAFDGKSVRYDAIELARLLRDKLFHGAPIEEKDHKGVPVEAFQLLRSRPDQIISELRSHCELEIGRWAIDTSIARAVAEGRASPLPVGHPAITTGGGALRTQAAVS
ncbi:hypothetical protein [Microvirga aerophila]|uniref:hypothetical protein n=1 Tax=Microvirga aerophila TaxID=670291 RepID=UPI0011BE747A|nr:hypothetical protein [Microvirga aerophila]